MKKQKQYKDTLQWFIAGFKFTLAMLKSFFLAVTQVAWGLTSLVVLGIALFYLRDKYGISIAQMSPLFSNLILFIADHIMLFVFVFFIVQLWLEMRELFKKE